MLVDAGKVNTKYSISATVISRLIKMTLITGSGRILTRKTVYDDSAYLDLTSRTGIYLIRLVTTLKTITKRIIQ